VNGRQERLRQRLKNDRTLVSQKPDGGGLRGRCGPSEAKQTLGDRGGGKVKKLGGGDGLRGTKNGLESKAVCNGISSPGEIELGGHVT